MLCQITDRGNAFYTSSLSQVSSPTLLQESLLHQDSQKRSDYVALLALDWPAIWYFESVLFLFKVSMRTYLIYSAIARSSTSLELKAGLWKKNAYFFSTQGFFHLHS